MKNEGYVNYRWIIVGVSFVLLALTYGATAYSFSLFFVALLKEFSWNRSITGGAFSVFLILQGVAGPFIGSMVDRFGPRKAFMLGALLLGTGLALCSLIQRWWEFYIFFSVVTAMGVSFLGFVPNATMIQQCFREKRGYAMGVISSGIGFGIFICVPLIQYLINRAGWRMTYRIIAVFIPLITFSMMIAFLRKFPRTIGSDDAKGENTYPFIKGSLIVDREWASRRWTVLQAARTKQFWLLWFSLFLSNFTIYSVLTHQVAFFIDQGLSALIASYIAGIIGIVSVVGKIVWGGLSDKIGREVTYLAGTVCSLCGMILLIAFTVAPNTYIPYLYAIFFGLGYAAVTALSPLITADFFEGQAFGSIFGVLFMSINLGGACGVWFTGFLYDQMRSYVSAFAILIACTLCALVNICIAAPRKIRMVPGKGCQTRKPPPQG
ncbi:MAG TPA: MFS transporter [Thermodesulfobacteriota bacterium]|nr:MFS transporter [Thermodesulfobacteriota bacterium]